jgi:hypothetical protein
MYTHGCFMITLFLRELEEYHNQETITSNTRDRIDKNAAVATSSLRGALCDEAIQTAGAE